MSEIQSGAASHPGSAASSPIRSIRRNLKFRSLRLVGGAKTSEETIRRAAEFYTSIGQRTVRLNTRKCRGTLPTALQAALAREVYYLVKPMASVQRRRRRDRPFPVLGPGLRWGVMGNMMLNHLLARRPGRSLSTSSSNSRVRWQALVEDPRLAGADAGSAKEAHRQRSRRGGIALHRRIGGRAR